MFLQDVLLKIIIIVDNSKQELSVDDHAIFLVGFQLVRKGVLASAPDVAMQAIAAVKGLIGRELNSGYLDQEGMPGEVEGVADVQPCQLCQGFKKQGRIGVAKVNLSGNVVGTHVGNRIHHYKTAQAGIDPYSSHGLITSAPFWPPKPKFWMTATRGVKVLGFRTKLRSSAQGALRLRISGR